MNPGTQLVIIAAAFAANAYAAREPGAAAAKSPVPKTETECIARGGQWISAGPQHVVKECLLFTNDAGKSCKKSSQCESECVERDTGNVCAETFGGCFEPTGRGTVAQCVN